MRNLNVNAAYVVLKNRDILYLPKESVSPNLGVEFTPWSGDGLLPSSISSLAK